MYSVENGICSYTVKVVTNISNTAVPCTIDYSTLEITLVSFKTALKNIPSTVPSDFATYISLLPEWESHLLRNVEISSDIFSIADLINQVHSVLAVTSDGSAPNFVGSFGWAAMITTKETIGKNKGAAPGYRATSFRAEAYGVLAVLLFIYHVYKFTGRIMLSSPHLYTDSESLVTKIADMVNWADYYQGATMDADWDVLQAIIRIIKTFDFLPVIEHVWGHQDDTTAYSDLSLPAQLNVDADDLAGTFVYDNDQSPLYVPLIKGSIVALHTSSGTIVSRYRQNLRRLFMHHPIKEYINAKNNWTNEFELVD